MNLVYQTFESPFGELCVVFQQSATFPRIFRIFLSEPKTPANQMVMSTFHRMEIVHDPQIKKLGQKFQKFLSGENISFALDNIALEICSPFQRKAILAEYKIPRGYISTYKRIAKAIGCVNGARAVGNAFANNPFPIIIPCHRAIKTDGGLGGYQGGQAMKRQLLEYEGIEFTKAGKVTMSRVFY